MAYSNQIGFFGYFYDLQFFYVCSNENVWM